MIRMVYALAAIAAGSCLASSVPAGAATRNYDCSKAGNANKAACKSAVPAAAPKADAKAKPMKEAKAPAKDAKVAAKAMPATASNERHYDCTKAGNANKAACKGAAAAVAKPAAKPMTKAVPKPASMPKSATPTKATPASASAENSNPAGAIAQCKDGTYSHAKVHSGACSRHGGVGKWLG
jgi:hypothetical protein